MAKEYVLRIPKEVEQRLLECTSSMREAIAGRLQEIVQRASEVARTVAKPTLPRAPALRFYVFEGYRVFYRIEPRSRRVVVLELRPELA